MKYTPEHLEKLNEQAVLAKEGCPDAKTWLLGALKPMCGMVVRRANRGCEELTDDLMQEAAIGILQAAKTFDPSFGVNFFNHALTSVHASVRTYLRRNRRAIRLPESKTTLKAYRFACGLTPEQRQEVLKDAKPVAKQLGIAEDHLHMVIGYMRSHELSTSVSVHARSETDDRSVTLEDMLIEDQSPEAILDDMQQEQRTLRSVGHLLSCLNEKEQIVVRRRMLVDETHEAPTLVELGSEIGVSGERVRQLEGIAMKKMRAASMSIAA